MKNGDEYRFQSDSDLCVCCREMWRDWAALRAADTDRYPFLIMFSTSDMDIS